MDFIVLKVNGKDLSRATHEQTIAAFASAKEPITVEVLKRSGKTEMTSEPISIVFSDRSTQTELTGGAFEGLFSFNTSSLPHHQSNQMMMGNDVIGSHYGSLLHDPDADEDDGCDVEYEEITLHRNPKEAKLGLTLCYGAPDEPDTDIYISEIDPDSVAAKDGRIQEGDQLLQINGVDVRSRQQAVNLFSERRSDFTLLLARPQLPAEEYILEEHRRGFNLCQGYNILLEQEDEDATTDTGTTENAHLEKDSGVGRTDESTKNDESSEHEAVDTCSISCGDLPSLLPHFVHDAYSGKDSGDSCLDEATLQEDFRGFKEQLTAKGFALTPLCTFQSDTSLDREMALLNREMENIQLECENLVHRHLDSQQKGGGSTVEASKYQMEHVYVNVSDLTNSQQAGKAQPPGKASPLSKQESVERWVNSMILPRKNGYEDNDSSSAYNTADSTGSVPLTLELTPIAVQSNRQNGEAVYGSLMSLVSPKMEDKGTQLRESDVASLFSCDSCRRCCRDLMEKDAAMSKTNIKRTNKPAVVDLDKDAARNKSEKNKNYVNCFPGPNTMYTNQANLEHTIWLQQQMLRQAILSQQKAGPRVASNPTGIPKSSENRRTAGGYQVATQAIPLSKSQNSLQRDQTINNSHSLSSPSKSGTLTTLKEDEEMKMEWKVKRRSDGTRYITRRPVRNRLLKARALKILEERAGVTTDDDAISELKTGRYWNKEDRKRHMERSRDRRKKEMVIRTRMTSVKEHSEENEDVAKKEVNILELSHKKMMRRRGKLVFDDFTTVQEVLAHGAKIQNSGGKPLGLLTVTTV